MSPPPAPDVRRPRIRVMVVDDSAVVRGFIVRILEGDPDIEIAATCSNGQTAVLQIARHKPDVVILDIEMPVMDGLTALPKLRVADPDARIVIASTLSQKNAEISLQALALGATDYIAKPTASRLGASDDFRRELLAKVSALGPRSSVAPVRAPASVASPGLPAFKLRCPSGRDPKILAIGSSTGGPQALLALLKALPARVGAPIVIAQHMPATFTTVLAQHLARASGRPCAEAVHGEPVVSGRIYLAPGDFHFEIERRGAQLAARLTKAPPENFCRPSVNPLLRSVARAFGAQSAAVMLTGMGSDGLDGAREIASAGGAIFAQDEASSVVWGMPGAVAHAGLCTAVLPLAAITPRLDTLFSESRR